MATTTQIKSSIKVAVAAARQERTIRRAALVTAEEGVDVAVIADARHDVALIEGIVSTLQVAYERASGLDL